MIIDAHTHLWEKQHGTVNSKPVYDIGNGKSYFGGEIRQMTPPYIIDGKNTVEKLIANMDFAQVNCAVVTQEYIDGNQDEYLLSAKEKFPDRLKICSLYEENDDYRLDGFDGIKICAARFTNKKLTDAIDVFKKAQASGKFVAVEFADGDAQVGEMKEIISECPDVKIAIGHFGMVTRDGWKEQIKLARNKNVYIESGGITWLFNSEFYPFPSAVKAVLEAAEICGMGKLMWGSDYPRTMTAITYKMSLDFITKSDMLTDEDKKKFIGENALQFYGFKRMPDLPYVAHMAE